VQVSIEQIQVVLNPDVLPSGTDLAVVNAARRSFGSRSEELSSKDIRLIQFLARGLQTKDWEDFLCRIEYESCTNQHSDNFDTLKELLWKFRNTPTHDTPFNHCHISFEVKAPIFVARQLVKTEYAPFSEFSRRYITEDVEFYLHDYREASTDKKQGSGGIHSHNTYWQKEATKHNRKALETYNSMLAGGVAPEQARGVLPQDLMTSWTWSATLGAFAKMCRERLGSDAQKETRYVAEQVYAYLKQYYPHSAVALVEGC